MKNPCETYGTALMAHLEGSLPAAVAAEMAGHLGVCGACRAELAAMKEFSEMLEAMGVAEAARVPQIDVTQGVLAGAAELRSGRRVLESLLDEREDLVAYLDEELDDFSAARIERERAKDALLDAELNDLAALGAELSALGASASASVPKVDLVASIVARAKARAVESDALPEVFQGLPEGIRLAAERFIEGEATAEQAAELREFAAASPDLATALEAYTQVHDGLEALALDAARAVPRIDIVAGVMAAVHKMDRGQNVTPMRRGASAVPTQPKKRGTGWWLSAVAAAAACMLVGLYLGQTFTQPDAPKAAEKSPENLDPVAEDERILEETLRLLSGEGEQQGAIGGEGEGGEAIEAPAPDPATDELLASGNGARTLKDVLDLRRKAFEKDQEALARLVRWSTLSEEEARKIASDTNADPQAIIGAAEFLPAAEAAALLKAAVDRNPDDPYLRKALAKAYTDNGDTELARQALDAWNKLDPENSMSRYMAARLAFQEGDTAGGLQFLGDAAHLERGSMYSAQSAQYRRGALGANGYTNDVAGFLAGSTAGTGDYRYVSALANDLIDQGNQMRDAGQYEDAQRMYLGVYNLGAQLSNSAQLVNEFDTAYFVQDAALQALLALSQLFSGVDPALVEGLLSELNSGIAALGDLMQVYDNIFNGGNMDQLLELIAATLGGGQLDFLQR